MITVEQIKIEFGLALKQADTEIEKKMIIAEYNYRIKKFKKEGEEAYKLAYIVPYDDSDDCGCGT